ncbi:hypothetical protein [Paraburkholderia youngii]|uniref:hypothetical protein n=1 Tax=Paraburkholderia youngii TaxID=2782701 RepID=UPI003D2332ED
MRKPRIRGANVSGAVSRTIDDAPWPKWNYVEEPGETRAFRFDSGVSQELFPLAREFSNTLYRLRLELRARTLEKRFGMVMAYLQTLSKCPEIKRPQSISKISKIHLIDFQTVLARAVEKRPVMKRANAATRAGVPGWLRATVRDAWRLGVAVGDFRPDLGEHGLRDVPVQEESNQPIYSSRELKEIIRFLIKRREVPRGTTLASERAYLASCICVLAVFVPINRASAFALKNNSLHRGEADNKFDVIVVVKERPAQSANRVPEVKGESDKNDVELKEVKRGKSQIRKIFEENRNYNGSLQHSEDGPLFECMYNSVRAKYHGIYGPINTAAFRAGMKVLHGEFEVLGDNGEPLRISLRKLRRTLENRLPENVRMDDKAKVLDHKNLNTTGTFYETVTDDDHLDFHRGLKAISIAVSRSEKDALVWARDSGISSDCMQHLLAGMLKTKVASCSDPISGELSPKDGRNCSKTLACFGCNALAVVVTDLYRIASLERRIQLDIDSGAIQENSKPRFEKILGIIDLEIFSQFERRLVRSAREKARRGLHPMWKRTISLVEL